ncbi:hypothetical protein A9Q84_17885 [Halobacteriovorax marinus]|uniref:Metallo-beta-lactamase domain-containing protein n=1 Tax=Halobacteriovorax marinus TaxID=97084 RepID=A0A1Y5F3T9_9BACT|nr:hypothetical protein A9Q84_17885 [Halobacteriovorax marinus]
MASLKKIISENVEGSFFVDSTCIDCDACRKIAPSSFVRGKGYSYVLKQPTSVREKMEAKQALISCPVGSIGMQEKESLVEAMESFPIDLGHDIYLNGFNHKSSYGADSYFIKSDLGNFMVDAPRFNKTLVKKMHEMGGLKFIFLTHKDDVADAKNYAREFGAKRIIHEDELSAQPDAEIVISGSGDTLIDDFIIMHTPGHTRGHMVLIWKEQYLFSGDHFAYSDIRGDWSCFKNVCWYNWEEQIESVERLARFPKITNVYPGHGRRNSVTPGEFPAIIQRVVAWMKT